MSCCSCAHGCASSSIESRLNIVPQTPSRLLRVVDTVCRVALAVLACWMVPALFAMTLAAGTLIGIAYGFIARKYPELALEPADSKPVCAQGYMSFFARVRFPAPVETIGLSAFIMTHIRCDPTFFVPFSGLFLGFGVGYSFVH